MPTAHLIFGFIGSGKTALARRLESRHDAVRFTPDEWMARLFGEDPPAETFQARAAAILDLMQPIWLRCLTLGVDVVLDFGFWSRAERDHARALIAGAGASATLWALDIADEEARRRIELRNVAPDRSLFIAPATYDALKARVEPLGPDEPYRTG